MRLRRWGGFLLVLAGAVGLAALGAEPITLGSGGLTLPLGGDAYAHDGSLTMPAAVPFAAVAVAGLLLLVLPRGDRGGA